MSDQPSGPDSGQPQPQQQSFNIPARLPEFVEDRENTAYANFVNVGFNENDCCLTFLRKPRPLSLDLEAVKAGEAKLELTALSRVYLPHEVARALCHVLAQNLAALDAQRAHGAVSNPN